MKIFRKLFTAFLLSINIFSNIKTPYYLEINSAKSLKVYKKNNGVNDNSKKINTNGVKFAHCNINSFNIKDLSIKYNEISKNATKETITKTSFLNKNILIKKNDIYKIEVRNVSKNSNWVKLQFSKKIQYWNNNYVRLLFQSCITYNKKVIDLYELNPYYSSYNNNENKILIGRFCIYNNNNSKSISSKISNTNLMCIFSYIAFLSIFLAFSSFILLLFFDNLNFSETNELNMLENNIDLSYINLCFSSSNYNSFTKFLQYSLDKVDENIDFFDIFGDISTSNNGSSLKKNSFYIKRSRNNLFI